MKSFLLILLSLICVITLYFNYSLRTRLDAILDVKDEKVAETHYFSSSDINLLEEKYDYVSRRVDDVSGQIEWIGIIATLVVVVGGVIVPVLISKSYEQKFEQLDCKIAESLKSNEEIQTNVELLVQEAIEAKLLSIIAATKSTEGKLSILDELVEMYEHRPLGYVYRAEVRIQLQKFDDAINDCETAIRKDENCYLAYYNKGLAQHQSSEYHSSIASFKEFLKFEPEHSMAYSNMGWAKINLGLYDEAIKDCKRAIELDTKNALARNNLAYAKLMNGDTDMKALSKEYTDAIFCDPHLWITYINRGHIRQMIGDTENALADFDKAILLNSSCDQAYSNRSWAHYLNNDLQHSKLDSEQAIAINKDNALAYANRAHVYLSEGEVENALLYYAKSLKLNSNAIFEHLSINEKNYTLEDKYHFLVAFAVDICSRVNNIEICSALVEQAKEYNTDDGGYFSLIANVFQDAINKIQLEA